MDLPASSSHSARPKQQASNPIPITPGVSRLGRYRITGSLGQGGMGVVYEAEDTLLKRQVALKLLPKEISSHPEALSRFYREGQGAARLNHPNVVAVYDIGESQGTPFIVMELVRGGSAQDYLRIHGRFLWAEATSIALDVCRGMVAAHKAGLIHRDIKPSNILRSSEGIVKLGDFGLVKPVGRSDDVTTLGGVIGTPAYMSPEQGQGGTVDERSDLYALGATYFALLTGRPPYQGADAVQVLFAHCGQPIPDPRATDPEIPEACTAIIHKAMAKNRVQRYSNGAALLADLEKILTGTAPTQSAPFVWTDADATDPFRIADSPHSERAMRFPAVQQKSWKALAWSLGALLLIFALVIAYAFSVRNLTEVDKDDWPSVAAASEQAIRYRQPPEMTKALEKLQILQKRLGPVEDAEQRKAISRLERALAFRESITEKGLVLAMSGQVSSVGFSPDDRWIGAGNAQADGGVVIWDSHTGEKRFILGARRNNVTVKVLALSFSHDSKLVAVGCDDGMGVKYWEIETGNESTVAVDKSVNRVVALAFAPGSRKLTAALEPFVAGPGRTYLRIWDIDTGRESFPFKVEHRGKVWAVTYSAAGQQIASGSQDKRVVMWNADTGRIWRELRTGLFIKAIACAPRGGVLAVAGLDQATPALQFWDYAGERMLQAIPSAHGECRALAYSPDGSILACGSGSKILLLNAETYALLGTLTGHGQAVASLAFSGKGGILASGSDDQTLRLWDVSRVLPARAKP